MSNLITTKGKLKEQSVVTKSNSINESHYQLSLLEQKIILAVISKIQPYDTDFQPYRFTIKELIDILQLKRKSLYKNIQRVITSLTKKQIHIKKHGI